MVWYDLCVLSRQVAGLIWRDSMDIYQASESVEEVRGSVCVGTEGGRVQVMKASLSDR